MASTSQLFVLHGLFLLLGVGYISIEAALGLKSDWTKLILTHHWPRTVCMESSCKTDFDYWTLHGLWTNKLDSCNKSWHFNMSEIQNILPEMHQWWPDILHPNGTGFWKHEWQKHGTCAALLKALDSQKKYFSKALELYKKINLTSVLKKFMIIPSSEYYDLDDIKQAIRKIYGVESKIQCVPSEEEQIQTLGQIEVCFDKGFQLIDCKETEKEYLLSLNEVLGSKYKMRSDLMVCEDSVPVYYPPVEQPYR
ncbi:ribonuclease T2 [Latimeria chalumnae]|uniref:Ribonuclease T2 n=1 Tax=Latimeria chalumnae TaxID=7897 RepID=H3B3E6_LATCH|nr:PREDICTED: ribonuclease T2-like [Latimeria chalumnae]XP_005994011.1 PREDICTED: ribonuclease T2-like [Latimeria chalumnae]|eukprot:XP_005994010.1 PREDICTED: ribonuclease T2-like [Latimeria chalumnae]